ncbi:acyl-coenzyme A thioesterase 5-like [Salarias fasciatus]|uniref:acyl-coenzyme A thioesterase 5-like n=1 Tax=Salarias fasciatus TaxID=181472 RepID=UPI0011766034|nr:acyl-coenzyme A thioesterase 5-like [Salarias fasciatus]
MASQVRLWLLPRARCLFDEPVQVKVAGLRSRQVVTMRARSIDQKNMVFGSEATYRADERGEIDLSRDPSLSGSYVGVEPMGLLWSMRPEIPHRRFQKANSQQPHVVKFSVHEEGEGKMLAEATNERLLMKDGVSRVPVTEGNIRGVLFIPPGRGPFPALLDLYTLGGGVAEKRSALLASRGFVVLTVSLYGRSDISNETRNIHLDYFEEAIKFLRAQNKVGGKGVGVISLSKSGDLALSVASFLPGVEATVWINGCSANTAFPLFYKEKQILPPLNADLAKAEVTESGAYMCKRCLTRSSTEENKDTLVPIEQAKGHFLFVASEDDLNWDSKGFMEQMVERLKHHWKENFESVCYPGAGHYLEPPYGPYCPSSIHSLIGKPVLWGGEPGSHSAAEIHLWMKIQEFFRTHLRCDGPPAEAKL